jgi:hypothetical protein
LGPSFGTKREEAFNALSQIMAQNAEAFKIGADIMFRAADFPMADELAERIKRTIPPAILGQGEPPEVQQIKEQAGQQVQGMQEIMARLVQENADKDLKLKQRDEEMKLKDYEAETRRMQAAAAIDPEAFKPVIRALISDMPWARRSCRSWAPMLRLKPCTCRRLPPRQSKSKWPTFAWKRSRCRHIRALFRLFAIRSQGRSRTLH